MNFSSPMSAIRHTKIYLDQDLKNISEKKNCHENGLKKQTCSSKAKMVLLVTAS